MLEVLPIVIADAVPLATSFANLADQVSAKGPGKSNDASFPV